ncbi:MAG TPA: ABC transporter ATP-binding protein [Acidimicrobiales bacterium]
MTDLRDRDDTDPHGAAVDLLVESAPPGCYDEERPRPEPTPDEDALANAGAVEVLRRGVRVTPELREGLLFTMALAFVTATGKLAVPILIQQILDRGVRGPGGFRPAFVYGTAAVAVVAIVGLYLLARATYLRLVRATEAGLLGLRMRAFAHVHKLSVAEHNDQRRGALVARVTSDIETLAQFTDWGLVAWIVDSVLIVGAFLVMAVYDWRLALLTMAIFSPLLVLLPMMQRRLLAAQDDVRDTVGNTFSEVSEAITGASIVRAYGLEKRSRGRLLDAINDQYRARLRAARFVAFMFPLGDLFGATAVASAVTAGVVWGGGWGLDVGELVAFLFLIGLLLNPVAELSEILDRTQIAIAGWRKILGLLETPIDVADPPDALTLPRGALSIESDCMSFAYRDGTPVLRDVELAVPAGTRVAIVGETGSGKTTFAKLLCRLADPTAGSIRLGGVDLRATDGESRQRAIRLVPQDGFLFDASVGDNVRLGRPEADDDEVREAFIALGLCWWLDDLPLGLATPVGERGNSLSVGERQIVALARAQLGDPGLLVLDEATSAVDPETERALTEALARLAQGRTMVSIAHRLSTAEAADLVLVFDGGELVERGPHADLVAAAGPYAKLYASWMRSTRDNGDSDRPDTL